MATYSSAPEIVYEEFTATKSSVFGTHQDNHTLVATVPDNTIYELVEFYGVTTSGGIRLTLIANKDIGGSSSPSVFSRIMPLLQDGCESYAITNPGGTVGGSATTENAAFEHAIIGTQDAVNNSTAEPNEYRHLTETQSFERRIYAGYSITLNLGTHEINDGNAKAYLRFKKTTFP